MSDKQLERMLCRIRENHPGITIILPREKEHVPMSELHNRVKLKASSVKTEYDIRLRQWKGSRTGTHISQVKEVIKVCFHFDDHPQAEAMIDEVIKKVLKGE